VIARWYDPRTGGWYPAGAHAPRHPVVLEPPAPGDWVIVVEAAAR
jgi:hypothetical protein